MGDQALRRQMAEEQEAIRAALAGRVHGTDALEDRSALIAPLDRPDVLDGDEVEASEEARSELPPGADLPDEDAPRTD